MNSRNTLEFWLIDGGHVMTIETSAAPPPIGATLPIEEKHYTVQVVSYAIEKGNLGEYVYKRYVYLKEIK